jgi:hypothetical protein
MLARIVAYLLSSGVAGECVHRRKKASREWLAHSDSVLILVVLRFLGFYQVRLRLVNLVLH